MNKLYLISQAYNSDYVTYDSAVVCATSPAEAVKIHPDGHENTETDEAGCFTWAAPSRVTAVYIGEAAEDIKPGTVLCASFNAG